MSTICNNADEKPAWWVRSKCALVLTIALMYNLIRSRSQGLTVLSAITPTQVVEGLSSK